MHILLIQPRDETYRYRGFFRRSLSFAPLTMTTLAALVPDELDARITIVDEGAQRPEYGHESYDVVGITCVASSSPRAYRLARRFRDSGAFVVLGGVHPTLNAEEASAHADVVVAGFAERVWPKLLLDLHHGRALDRIYQEEAPPLLSAPPPRRDLLRRNAYLRIPTVIASRGCAHHCKFCAVPPFCGRNPCPRPVEEVIDEIRAMDTREVVFFDSNLAADPDYAHALMEALIPLNLRWFSSVTADFVDDPVLFPLLVRSGCFGVFIGLESMSQASVTGCGKRFNEVARYEKALKTFHEHDISVMCSFMLGFDDDTEEIFTETLDFVDRAHPDSLQFGVVTPFPGTPLFEQFKAENRILSEDWGLYDTQHVVYQPQRMSPAVLQRGLQETWKRASSLTRLVSRIRRVNLRRPRALVSTLGFWLYSRRVASDVVRTADHLGAKG